MATITLGNNTYTLVALPSSPGFNEIGISMMDAIAVVSSPWVPSQTQTQQTPGADAWSAQVSLPKMTERQAGAWKGFLASTRGMLNVFQLGDPLRSKPYGIASGAAPVVNGANALNATTLLTRGWPVGAYRLLLPGDYIQIGYRLHVCCSEVDSDGAGDAAISIWPSLRDPLADGAAIVLNNCKGVFRLAANMRGWHAAVDQLTQISLKCTEVR